MQNSKPYKPAHNVEYKSLQAGLPSCICCSLNVLKTYACAEVEEVQPSGEASVVGNGAEQKRDAKKGRKGKKKGRVAALQEAESTGSTATRPSVIMVPSKGILLC